MKRFILTLFFCGLLAAVPAVAQERPQVFDGATLLPIGAAPIENGVMVVHDGIIAAVGEAGEVDIPADAAVRDASGKVIMPGLVDTHSHVGNVSGGDRSAPMHPGVRALDASRLPSGSGSGDAGRSTPEY